jgi:arabinofuranan 3-O-arabinosyltransferase
MNLRKTIRQLPPMAVIALAALIGVGLWSVFAGVFSPRFGLEWSDKDFANYWMAARLVFEGRTQDLFGPHPGYFVHMRETFGADYPWHNWSYPPNYLFTVLPLGFLPYKVAMVAYLLGTFLLFCGAFHLGDKKPGVFQLVLLIPAVFANIDAAQNGFLTAALLIGGLAARETRPIFAGILIGLLTVKPQLGFLLPLLLLFERRWLVIGVAAATAIALGALSLVIFGLASWQGYLHDIVPYQTKVMAEMHGPFQLMVPSTLGSFLSFQAPFETAMAIHLVVAATALALYCASLQLLKNPGARAASTVFAIFVITPYSVTYDLVSLSAAVCLWCVADARRSGRPADRYLVLACMAVALLPMLTPAIIVAGLPVSPLVIIAAWCLMLGREGMLQRLGDLWPLRNRLAPGAAADPAP